MPAFYKITQAKRGGIMKYPCVKQKDLTDCGVACLATISRFYGSHIPLNKIREYAKTDKLGNSADSLTIASKKLNMDAVVKKTEDKTAIIEYKHLPVIAHLITKTMLEHYVVIYNIYKNEVTIADPATGIIKYELSEFLEMWTGVIIDIIPNNLFTKTKKEYSTIRKLLNILTNSRSLLLNIFIYSFIITGIGIATSLFYLLIMDYFIPNNSTDLLPMAILGIIFLYISKGIIDILRQQIIMKLVKNIDLDLIIGSFNHIIQLPMNFFSTRKKGEIVSRLQDTFKIHEVLCGIALSLLIDSTMTIFATFILWYLNSSMFIICVIVVVLYFIITKIYEKELKLKSEELMIKNTDFNSILLESLNGIETVKTLGAEKQMQDSIKDIFDDLIKKTTDNLMIQTIRSNLIDFISHCSVIAILSYGVFSVLSKDMTVGTLIMYSSLLGYFLEPIKNLMDLQPEIQNASVAFERLSDMLDLDKEDLNSKTNLEISNHITIKDVGFEYSDRERVLKDINLEITSGSSIALVGESGGGKSTLVKLILGLYPLAEGNIYFGDESISDIDKVRLRNSISYVSQEIFLFSKSISENLTLGYSSYIRINP